MNKMAKGEGGVIGLRENAAGFEKWMTAGPEMARLVDEFKQALQPTNNNDQRHHEQTAAHQKRYKQDLSSLKRKLSDLGNPFAEESDELPCLQKRLQVLKLCAQWCMQKNWARHSTWSFFMKGYCKG
ncbi:hypothetical protein ACOMHN_055157 [Nucella lapillus]